MTAQEILEGITRHRAQPLDPNTPGAFANEIARKLNEIEWALQAIAEWMVENEGKMNSLRAMIDVTYDHR